MLVEDAGLFHEWQQGESQLALGALVVVCAAIAYGSRRVLAPSPRSGPF